jgi:hypothetical protein
MESAKNGEGEPMPSDKRFTDRRFELLTTPETAMRIYEIDERTKDNSERLKELSGVGATLQTLASSSAANTTAINNLNSSVHDLVSILGEYKANDQRRWDVATGKGQIPLVTHFSVVGTLCLIILAAAVAWLRLDLKTAHFEFKNALHAEAEKTRDTVKNQGP